LLQDPVEPTSFWVNPFGVAWPLLKASDLILVNKDGKVVDGGPVRLLNTAGIPFSPLSRIEFEVYNPTAYMIHHAVHTARPEINCVAHSHSIYGRSFCTLGRNLDTITQDSCAFHNDIALYSSFRGIVLAEEEGIAIAEALGQKKAALLQNHGLLTCGKTIEAAVFWFMSLEKCCHAQLLADAAAGGRGGETVKIDDKDAAYTYQTVGTELAGWFSAKPTFDMMEHEAGVDYKW
jgi:ribulose-5-phosphate 4-epimerase/fuculose-1-phosphate aldolase